MPEIAMPPPPQSKTALDSTMDACIARGGISHVLSQARASLKNPSRPFTPRTNGRPLFHGDDYRPESRPSSSYSAGEQKELAMDARGPKVGNGPTGATLPPRPTPKSTSSRASMPTPPVPKPEVPVAKDTDTKRSELPCPQGPESANETDASGDDNEAMADESPSFDALAASLQTIATQLEALDHRPPESIAPQELETLVRQLTNFTSKSIPTGRASKRYEVSSNLSALHQSLFTSLVDRAVGSWHASAKCVVAIAPCIFELVGAGVGRRDDDVDAAKVVALGKVLFVLSKETEHDAAFCNVRFVESALKLMASRLCPMRTLIYVAGTLKNVSSGDKMIKLLATNGAIANLSDSLTWRSTDLIEAKEIAQFLVQTTTILRNLSTSKAYLKQFNEARVASRLCDMVDDFLQHQELMVNVSRILGKLTLHEAARSQINQNVERCLGNLVKLVDPQRNATLVLVSIDDDDARLNQGDKTQDVLLVRIFFVLGNLCASNDRNRLFLGVDALVVPVLLQSLMYYGQKYEKTASSEKTSECADVLVKLVRLLANMSMNADVGGLINGYPDELAVLLNILECAHSRPCDEELMLNIVSCLTNLSYYCTVASTSSSRARSFIETHRLDITSRLSDILWDANEEAVLEAARAFGNLSRFKDVLRAMSDSKVLDGFVILLDHSKRDIVYTVCGVLMNAALDEYARAMLLGIRQVQSGVGDDVVIDARTLLANILECAGLDDVEMSSIAGKVLYNLLLTKKDTSAQQYLASEDGRSLQRSVASIMRQLDAGDFDNEDDDASAMRRDLRDVLTQLNTNMPRSEY